MSSRAFNAYSEDQKVILSKYYKKIIHSDLTTIEKFGVIHYCVPNIPARYPKTASVSISNICLPYLLQIAEKGGLENALRYDNGLRNGLYLYRGILTNAALAEWYELPFNDINFLIF